MKLKGFVKQIKYCQKYSFLQNDYVKHDILLDIINSENQTVLLYLVMNYGSNFYLKFMWDVYKNNLVHVISILVMNCVPSESFTDSVTKIESSIMNILKKENLKILSNDLKDSNVSRLYNYASNSIHYYPFSTNTSKINEDL
ncbi:hypothetical protein H8356DRAFT_1332959 [Neocallimastix lanati (nom. inval.)]|nr:hypothetical protein H8356DRAFT_1332959 [Neocallimastix sp. JGI-2020a]